MPIFGCIADDFTGASDAASFLIKGGLSVQLFNGVPEDMDLEKIPSNVQAVVIALKSRTQEVSGAVADSLSAARFLLRSGVKQLYFKYCSTFDSTPKGNIGPVADALLELMHARYSVLCPSLPVNGRVVKNGNLYVNGIPLNESSMKNHPLTPMLDSDLSRLMSPQSKYTSYPVKLMDGKIPTIERYDNQPFYLIPDYETDEDGRHIAEAFFELPLLTGGSGLLEHLGAIWASKLSSHAEIPNSFTAGKAVLLSGSCSQATLAQVAYYQQLGMPSLKMDPLALLEGKDTAESLWEKAQALGESVLIYSSDAPEKVKEYQKYGKERVADLLEGATAYIARRAVQAGYTRVISAGGETSGAVAKALGYSSYLIGESVAPGVPIMVPVENQSLRLVLKSGNFGKENFFQKALNMTKGLSKSVKSE